MDAPPKNPSNDALAQAAGDSHDSGFSGSISEPFIRRPIGTSLLMVALMLMGIISYKILPVASLPRMDYPTFLITALLPGADPETMAASVAAPLERRFGQISGVSELTSVCGTGVASVTVQFALDRSSDAAARDIQAAITSARSELPANLPNPPVWRKANPADAPILIMALTSQTLPPDKVYSAASTVLVQRMSQVKGVAQVTIAGAQKSAVRVQVNPTALANMGLGMEDVRTTLLAADAHGSKGRFDGPDVAYSIETNDQLYDADAYKSLVLKSKKGSVVRLSAVAKVVNGVVDTRQIAWFNHDRSVLLLIFKQPNANVIETVDAVKELMPQLERWIPASIKLSILSDRTTTIRASVSDVEFTLLLTVALVVAIVFLFLGKLWSTFAAASTVPLSLAGTCAGMYLCGYTIDNLSLMALTVAVGFVVDDAIVMIENISRRHEMGDNPLQAALLGAKQIGFTVVSISISLVAVFIPLLFMKGLVGRLFREFAVTLSMSIGISALVSLTCTPMICAYLARDNSKAGGGAPHKNWLERASDAVFTFVLRYYGYGLDIVLRHRSIMMLVTLGTIALTVYLYIAVPHGLFPQQDTGRIQVTTEAPTDISFTAMVERQHALTEIMLQNPDILSLSSAVGASPYNAVANQGRFFIELKPLEERTHTTDEVTEALQKASRAVQGISFNPRPVQDIQVGGRPSKLPYLYALSDIDVGEMNDFAPKLLDSLKKIKELSAVTTDQTVGALESRLVIDRDAAARYNISPSDIDAALYDSFGQRQVAIMYTEIDQYRVVLEVDPELLKDPSSLEKVYVKSRDGRQIPLRNLATFQRGTLPLSINHQGQFPSVTVSFALAPGVPLGLAADKIEAATRELNPPPGLRASFQGTAQIFQDTLSTMPILILTSLLAIYIILGVLYESLIHPITILSTIPSAGIGALLALMYFNYPLDVMSLIGIILLIGIVKKNAIMMIDFALEAERDHAKSPVEAIREACMLRFRPIIMTTMAALLGALPLALGHGSGSELRRPLGVAIVGGLMMSQVLTLFTTPVIYVVLDSLRAKKKKLVSKPEHTPDQKPEAESQEAFA